MAADNPKRIRLQWHHYLKVYNHYSGHMLGYIGCLTPHNLLLMSHWPLLIGKDYQLRLFSGKEWFKVNAYCSWSIADNETNNYESNLILPHSHQHILKLCNLLTQSIMFLPSSDTH